MDITGLLGALQGDLASVAASAQASMVQVRTGRDGAGTGTITDADGLVVTNAHVARHRHLEVVLHDGRRLPATVEAFDPRLDLAALRIEARGLPAIPLGSSRQLRAGELVLAVGHPWGVEGGATLGVVIGVGADLPENPQPWRDLVAVSLHLRPGHSGGPLADVHGRLVGISTMMAGPEVGLAVPVDALRQFLIDRLPSPIARAA
ncbi:MAG: serine protease [Anaerolineales bacterium]|nr:serine protease [Anaerolineales bacterium]